MKLNVTGKIDVYHHHGNVDVSEVVPKLNQLLSQGEMIMATQAELIAQVNAATAKLTKIGTETTTLLTKIAELTAIITAGPVSPELQAAVDALTVQAQVVDDLNPDAPAPPTP